MDSLPSGEPKQGASGQVNFGWNEQPPEDSDRNEGAGDYDPGAAGQISYGLDASPPVGTTAPAGNGGGFNVNFDAVAPLTFKPGEITTHALPAPLA